MWGEYLKILDSFPSFMVIGSTPLKSGRTFLFPFWLLSDWTVIVNIFKTNLSEVQQVRKKKQLTLLSDYTHVRDQVSCRYGNDDCIFTEEIALYGS